MTGMTISVRLKGCATPPSLYLSNNKETFPVRPKYTHDCTNCVFIGVGAYCEKDVDWYVCKSGSDKRTVLARYSDKGSDYSSATIGDTAVPCRLVLAALAQGLDLTQTEKDILLKQLLVKQKDSYGPLQYKNIMYFGDGRIGEADWLNTK